MRIILYIHIRQIKKINNNIIKHINNPTNSFYMMYAIKSACNISRLYINNNKIKNVKIYYSIYKYRLIRHEIKNKTKATLTKEFCDD